MWSAAFDLQSLTQDRYCSNNFSPLYKQPFSSSDTGHEYLDEADQSKKQKLDNVRAIDFIVVTAA